MTSTNQASPSGTLTITDFAGLFGAAEQQLPPACTDLIIKSDWGYSVLEGRERDVVVLDLLKRIQRRDFSIVNPADKSRWLRGWDENLKSFLKSGGADDALAPKYIRPGVPMRLNQKLVRLQDAQFELKWYRVFQEWLFRAHLQPFDHIYEFGSGSGINVAMLAQMYPQKRIVGLDWAKPACDIVDEMRRLRGWNTEGRLFDFFSPDPSLRFPPNSAVLTVGALEQTGTEHGAFIDFILARKPALCVFIEPIYDWYDPDNLVDYLALWIHDVRNFWKGFPERLAALQAQGRVEIVKRKRSFFGSLLLEGYSQTIWRPA
jgi:hypothetical protein